MTNETRQRTIYVASDYAATNVAWLIFNMLRFDMLDSAHLSFGSLGAYLTSHTVVIGQLAFPLVMMAIYWMSGYYNLVFRKSRAEEFVSTFTATLIGALLIFFLVLLNDMTDNLRQDYALFAILFGVLFGCVYVCRWAITTSVVSRIHSGRLGFPTLIVGCGDNAGTLVRQNAIFRSMGFKIAGVVRVSPDDAVSPGLGNLPLIELPDIAAAVRRHGIHNLIVMQHPEGREHTLALINSLFELECALYMSPDEFDFLASRARTSDVVGEPLLDISRTEMPQSTLNLKRLADIVLAGTALAALSPVMLAVAAAVRLDSPGPVFYRQRRIGYHKRPFDIIKFRTMHTNAEADGPQLSRGDDDPRITRLGRFLRKYRIDELPQFWNVLRGEMSVVGPRPEREFYIRRIMQRAPYYALLHRVRPGITSWGMVRYGYATTIDEMVDRLRYDLLYLENMSFAVDIKIIFYTIRTVLNGSGK